MGLTVNIDRLESLAAGGGVVTHGLAISVTVLNNFLIKFGDSLHHLQLQSCALRPFTVPALHQCTQLRHLNLGGTLLLFSSPDLSYFQFGQWLLNVGQHFAELVLMGAILADETLESADILMQVLTCQEFCRVACPQAQILHANFTAVNDSPRLKQGFPTNIGKLHEQSALLALPSFLNRARSSSNQQLSRVNIFETDRA